MPVEVKRKTRGKTNKEGCQFISIRNGWEATWSEQMFVITVYRWKSWEIKINICFCK